MAIENVEDYVRKTEKEMFNNTGPGATWFEEYVRHTHICTITLCSRVSHVT